MTKIPEPKTLTGNPALVHSGFNESPIILEKNVLSNGNWAGVMMELIQRGLGKIGIKDRIFMADDLAAYHRCIPENQPFTGKDLTFPTEQDNSNTRHYSA